MGGCIGFSSVYHTRDLTGSAQLEFPPRVVGIDRPISTGLDGGFDAMGGCGWFGEISRQDGRKKMAQTLEISCELTLRTPNSPVSASVLP
ncbi:MAG: hypothetical protein EAZ61_02925 [Oscillatoriales cyanobacterium]|nr:MAG: hypothetical protein EAZ61_02925 [Oscillatoriales cyanobacterium]